MTKQEQEKILHILRQAEAKWRDKITKARADLDCAMAGADAIMLAHGLVESLTQSLRTDGFQPGEDPRA